MSVMTLRIVELGEEASLLLRAIWNYGLRKLVWDPRFYYVALEIYAALISSYSALEIQKKTGRDHPVSFPWYAVQILCSGIYQGLAVSLLYWYSNQRQSAHLLTRAGTHVYVLLFLAVTLFLSQIFPIQEVPSGSGCEVMDLFIWLSICLLLLAALIVFAVARNPQRDPMLAELPSPTAAGIDLKDDIQVAWASINVADAIGDFLLRPDLKGQLRI